VELVVVVLPVRAALVRPAALAILDLHKRVLVVVALPAEALLPVLTRPTAFRVALLAARVRLERRAAVVGHPLRQQEPQDRMARAVAAVLVAQPEPHRAARAARAALVLISPARSARVVAVAAVVTLPRALARVAGVVLVASTAAAVVAMRTRAARVRSSLVSLARRVSSSLRTRLRLRASLLRRQAPHPLSAWARRCPARQSGSK